MIKVTFCIENGRTMSVEAAPSEKLMDIAKRSGINIDAPCNGNGTCRKCRVKILEGEVVSDSSHAFSRDEYAEGWRLACQSIVTGDITVMVPAAASAFKSEIKTADLNAPKARAAFDEVIRSLKESGLMEEQAVFTKQYQLDAPSLEDTMPDNERLLRAVEDDFQCSATLSFHAMKKLSWELRENDFNIRAVLSRRENDVEILSVLPGNDLAPICGLAVDIGTTTVSAVLADMETGDLLAKASVGNGQIRYGADVINRIIESTRPGGSERLRRAIVEETLIPLINGMCVEAGIAKDRIYRVSIAGNTTMEHLLLALYSDPIRMEPYIPTFFKPGPIKASEVIPGLNPCAELLLAPNVGSYVGGDITAGVLSSGLWKKEETTLFIDLGTNGELVIGNQEYMMCCACSAGPAFEGGDISCGMRATKGAIDTIKIDPETMEPTYTVIGDEGQKPTGLCGSGIIDTVAELYRTGIISARGKMAREGKRIAHDENGMGRYILAFPEESGNNWEISINEVDLDNFIRAKGAIFSAILLLLGQLGMEPADVNHIMIAGGIGGAIDFRNAITIGMFPDVPEERFSYIGNSSLSGAYAGLLSRAASDKTTKLGENMMYVELSNEPGYMDEFVAACFLPHTNSSLFPSVV